MFKRTRFVPAALLSTLLLCSCATQKAGTQPTPDMKALLREAIAEDPDIVLDALRENDIALYEIVQAGANHQQIKAEQDRLAFELANPYRPYIDPDRPQLGPADAPIQIVAYSDFLCPYCSKGSSTIKDIMEMHPGKIAFSFKHNPRNQFTKDIAIFFEAIAKIDEDKAWEFHDKVFARQNALENGKQQALIAILMEMGIDMNAIRNVLDDKTIEEYVTADEAEAERFGFNGTPFFVVNGVSIRGAYPASKFEEVIKLTTESGSKSKGSVGLQQPTSGQQDDGELCIECLEKE